VQDILVPSTAGQQAPTFYAMVVLNDNGLLPSEGDASGTDFHQKTFKEVSELAKDLGEKRSADSRRQAQLLHEQCAHVQCGRGYYASGR
jgi:hypothetical protein